MIIQLVSGIVLSILISGIGYRRGALSPSGVVGALIVGVLTFGLGGWLWGLLLAVFFVTSSVLSHFKEKEKRVAAEKFDKGHRRDFGQAMANGGAGALVALLNVLFPVPGWFPFFTGVMATVTADTWATELGTRRRAACSSGWSPGCCSAGRSRVPWPSPGWWAGWRALSSTACWARPSSRFTIATSARRTPSGACISAATRPGPCAAGAG